MVDKSIEYIIFWKFFLSAIADHAFNSENKKNIDFIFLDTLQSKIVNFNNSSQKSTNLKNNDFFQTN